MHSSDSPKEILILAGGLGSRLRSMVTDVPKPMALVKGRPFLEYVMDYWITQGVRRIVLSVGYMGNIIANHFSSSYKGILIDYVEEEDPLGTGGALKKALTQITWSGGNIFVVNGDTWFNADLTKLILDHRRLQKMITLSLKAVPTNDRYGVVEVDEEGVIQRFKDQDQGAQGGPALINAGCYLLRVQEVVEALRAHPDSFSLEKDFLKPMAQLKNLASSVQDGFFLDIGIPEDYKRAQDLV